MKKNLSTVLYKIMSLFLLILLAFGLSSCKDDSIVDDENNDNDIEVFFDLGNAVDSFSVLANDAGIVIEPTNPVKDGHDFLGWYTDLEYTTLFDFNSEIVSDITLYSKFVLSRVFSISESIIIYKNNNERVTQEFLRLLGLYTEDFDDIAPGYISDSTENIQDILEGNGNGISYNLYTETNGNGNFLNVAGYDATIENIVKHDYPYVTRMEAINRHRWSIGDVNGDYIWHIGENDPYAYSFATGLLVYIQTKDAAEIIRLNQGIIYDYQYTWEQQNNDFDYACGDNFLNFEEMPTLRIGVAPGVESIARALVEGFHEVCPNFTPSIEITETNDIYRRVQGDLSAGDTSTYLHFGFGDRIFDSYDTEPTYGGNTATITLDAIVFNVSADNPITHVTPTDIWYIFEGTYKNWDDLEGN